MNKNYAKGKRFERKTVKDLESKGWYTILQAMSQFPDIVAAKISSDPHTSIIWAVECKVKAKYLRRKEKIKLKTLERERGFLPLLAYPVRSTKDKRKVDIIYKYIE